MSEIDITTIEKLSKAKLKGVKERFNEKYPDLIFENQLHRITKAARLDQTHIEQYYVDQEPLCRAVCTTDGEGRLFLEFFTPKIISPNKEDPS